MTVWQALILGAVQGMAEFLPISSSGHLVLLQSFFNLDGSNLLFDTLVHVATLLSVVVFFWSDIIKLTFRNWVVIAVGTIPAVVIGLLFKDQIEVLFNQASLVSITLILSGIINFLSDRRLGKATSQSSEQQEPVKVSWRQSLVVGLFQAFAIIPGISRSGSTVLGGLTNGLSRREAFRFSFLLSIPAIIGATVLQAMDASTADFSLLQTPPFVFGALMAFVSGLASLVLFKYVMRSARMEWFGWYCVVVGVLSFLIFS